jgi:hypothetical protein
MHKLTLILNNINVNLSKPIICKRFYTRFIFKKQLSYRNLLRHSWVCHDPAVVLSPFIIILFISVCQ